MNKMGGDPLEYQVWAKAWDLMLLWKEVLGLRHRARKIRVLAADQLRLPGLRKDGLTAAG